MNWFTRKNKDNIKKRDNKSTYLKVENGRVVPVLADEKDVEKPPVQDESSFETKESEELPIESKGASFVRWLWLFVIIGLGYGTLQLFGGIASESRENIKLQEIQQNTLQIAKEEEKEVVEEDVVEKEVEVDVENKVEEENNEENVGSNNNNEVKSDDSNAYLGKWRDKLKKSFAGEDNADEKAAEPKTKETSKIAISDEDSSLLLAIRSLDEDGTTILEGIRDDSVGYMDGTLSKGQYTLRLKSVELKLNNYREDFYGLEQQVHANDNSTYGLLLDYIWMKTESLDSIVAELRIVSSESVANVFNENVDVHNELTIETDKEFVIQLKQIGYEAEILNGVIEYR